jgi:hypothetical protein
MHRPTLRNRGSYGGGLLHLPAQPPVDAVSPWRIRWVLHYEKGEPAIGVVDAAIADVDDTAIFYDPSFCGMSCKRGTVWRGDVAVLQASDDVRRCAKGSVLRCEIRPDGIPAGALILCVERLDSSDGQATTPTYVQQATAAHSDDIDPEAAKCEDWSIRRLRQWLQLYDSCPHPDPPEIKPANNDRNERAVLASRVRCTAAWLKNDAETAQAGAEPARYAEREGRWCRLLRIGVDPSTSAWAAACYSAGSFKVTLLEPPALEILNAPS